MVRTIKFWWGGHGPQPCWPATLLADLPCNPILTSHSTPFSTSRGFAWHNLNLRELLPVVISRCRLACSCRAACICHELVVLCLVVIKYRDKDSNCDSKEHQNRPKGRLGDTSVVHNAVIRDAVVAAELFEGGPETMDVVGKISPRSNHGEGHDHHTGHIYY